MINVIGKITDERYYDDKSKYGVYEFETLDEVDSDAFERRGRRRIGIIAGEMQRLDYGVEYVMELTESYSKKYQQLQFKPNKIYEEIPKTDEEKRRFLNSILTIHQTNTLLEHYPNIITDIMEGKDIDISVLKNINETRFKKIKDKIIDNYVLSELLAFLSPYGVTYKQIRRISGLSENQLLLKDMIKENPYILTQANGLGFLKVDIIALKLRPELKNSEERVRAYLDYLFESKADSDGHTWLLRSEVIEYARKSVPECVQNIKAVLDMELENPTFLHQDGDMIGRLYDYNVESEIYDELVRINSCELSFNRPTDELIDKILLEKEEENGFELSEEQDMTVRSLSKEDNVIIVSGSSGCVDNMTEFFNGYEWKYISDYAEGDMVLQYNEDNSAELVFPLEYHKYKEDKMYFLNNKINSVNQVLSLEHNVAYLTRTGKLMKKSLVDVIESHNNNKSGFTGKFINNFDYVGGSGISLTDDEIRLTIAVMADGTFNTKTNWCRINIKKNRKKERLVYLLNKCGIEYKSNVWNNTDKDYMNYCFYAPVRTKTYPKDWYNATKKQLEIICEELLLWDGSVRNGRKSFSTTIKSDADFVQFAWSSIGYTSNILTYDRTGQKYKESKYSEYVRKSIEYDVSIGKNKYSRSSLVSRESVRIPIKEYIEHDGYKYCFTVPSSYLVLRRDGRIFVTGNSGKTTVVKYISDIYSMSDRSVKISQIALSAKASIRMRQVTGRDASTIHSFLYGLRDEASARTIGIENISQEEKDRIEQLDNIRRSDVVIIDEFSMVNIYLTLSVLKQIKDGAIVIFVFDYAQLPAIGAGSVAYDLLEYSNFKKSKYKDVHRQGKKSGILVDSNIIKEQKNPLQQYSSSITTGEMKDMTYVFRNSQEEINAMAIKTFMSGVEKFGIDNINIITPRKNKTLNSAESINNAVQELLIPSRTVDEYIHPITKRKFRLGDRVIHRKNMSDLGVFNGEMGVIISIDMTPNSQTPIKVSYDNGFGGIKKIVYDVESLNYLYLSYALTVHSYQGSENKAILVVMDKSSFMLLDNTMLYTAITRAKERCILITDTFSFNKCITEHKTLVRNTWLKKILRESEVN